ncbi:MAG: symmetrical bis(5'-nucleosyl)-tetraphosphatase [Cellvibrionaceae bacterium]|nr:symmetrical bis(5'-nucleosyl)-tetraphosphatase [Cellvibrionaceae bacterium]MCV6624454.1 symmetrical bis(5'-nucleosyl)-tetraphosphatase [Cellvibrionaceae bacterium]
MATYAVGDIQGCFEPLLYLLEQISFDPAKDKLWVAGDLINRGPRSLDTLRFIKSLDHCTEVVLGNHDLSFLAYAHGFQPPRDGDTIEEILRADDCDELVYWLRQQKLIHHDPELGYAMVHAGIPPQWTLQKALRRAAEVEAVLQDDDAYSDFLLHMFGSEPRRWRKGLKGNDRLRLITNYFTRMRFVDEDGTLEFQAKSGPESAPKGFKPWYKFKKRKTCDDKIIFGHWAALQGFADADNVFPLDTGCVWGGELTVMCLEDGQFYSCSCKKS